MKKTKEIKYNLIEKKIPREAKKFVTDQQTIILFLNSPVREKWLKFLRLEDSEVKKINKIIDYYAKQKIREENKRKPKTKTGIIKIENFCLRKIFFGKLIRFKNIDELEAITITKNLLKREYPKSVIFEPLKVEKLSTLTGIKKPPTDFLIFDSKNKKIIGIEIVIQ